MPAGGVSGIGAGTRRTSRHPAEGSRFDCERVPAVSAGSGASDAGWGSRHTFLTPHPASPYSPPTISPAPLTITRRSASPSATPQLRNSATPRFTSSASSTAPKTCSIPHPPTTSAWKNISTLSPKGNTPSTKSATKTNSPSLDSAEPITEPGKSTKSKVRRMPNRRRPWRVTLQPGISPVSQLSTPK